VRIIGVSVDDEKDTIKQRVESKKWNKIVHLTLLGWKNDHGLIKDYKIQGIPFVCLVDKFGKVNYVGHPSQVNLEERINELVKQTSEAKQEQAAAPEAESKSAAPEADFNKIVDSFTKEKVEEVFKDVGLFCFVYTKE
jgi:hypothetical protein